MATPCARYVGAPVVVDGAPWGVLEFYALDHTDRAQARLPQVSARRSRGPGLAAADEDALIVLAGLIGHAVAHERCEDALARASADLARLTEIDPLTQLQNRRGVETTLRRLARRQLHGGGSFTALLVDLDDFKHINDTFGHATGDDVLAKTAALIQSVVRPTDVVGRIGGDEFLALLPGANLEQAQGVAERVRAALASDSIVVFGGTVTVTVTASIGVAEIRTEACTVKDILARTSDLLRESKRAGKNRLSCA